MGGVISVNAQTDVTSTYLTNANFEGSYSSYAQPSGDRDIYLPDGWEISYTNGEGNDLTSLSSETTQWGQFSGKPQPANGGSQTYWMRFRWGGSENITLSQETSANLPAGTYAVTVDAYSDDNTGTATISAAGVSQTIRTNGAWANYAVVFTLASAQKVTVSLSYINTAADDHATAFDNVKILDLNSEPTGITLRNELGGTAANLSDFNVWYDDYTLEVGGTADTEITIAADNISYTPEATGTVRFVKKDGIVYVFEGATYKTAVHSSKAAYTYSRTLSKDDPITGNYLSNPSFETTGDLISGQKYYLGTPWSTNYSGSDIRVDKGTKSGIHGECVLVWRGSGSGKEWYFTQQVTTIPKYKGVKMYLEQIDAGNANAKFNVGFGNAAGDYSYLSSQVTLGTSQNGVKNAELGYNENMATGDVYFTFRNTSSNTSSSGNDPVSQIDWIGLVGSDDFAISGTSSASYVYGAAYAPATAKTSYLAAKAEAEATIVNATYDNVTGSERSSLQSAIDAAVDDNDAAYNTATDNIQTAISTFTSALSHYQALIDAQAAVPDLAYASTSASAFKTAVATSASDADAKLTAITPAVIRAYYESHALAEGVACPINKTSLIVNPVNPTNTSGWTVTNTTGDCKMRTMSNEPYTNSDETTATGYFDTNSWGAAFTSTFTQSVNLPAGDYMLTVKARGNGTTTYQLTAGGESTDITTSGSSGGVFGRGWNDFSVEFTVASAGDVTIGINMETGASSNWLSFGDFRLVRLDATAAEDADYAALNGAITTANSYTLGFEDGEYAPYNNVDALTYLAEAKAINQSADNAKDEINALKTALSGATWTANGSDVDAIYNGSFASGLTGWTRTNSWGQQQTGLSGTYSTAYYNQPGSLQYGNQGVYTMPLAANTAYTLTFAYRSHENNSNNKVTVSVLNDSDEGLHATIFPGNGSTSEWKVATKNFKTGAAGDYVLTLANDGNTWMTGVSLVKATTEEVTVSSAGFATYVSDVDLNYDGVSGLTAYKASVSGERVILTPVTAVPAGAGVVLKGDAGTYYVPVTTGAGTLSGNALVRGTGVAVVTSADSKNNYVLSTDNDGNNVGFYQANGETVPTYRAYLQTTAASPARLIIVFEDEATGISTVQSVGFMVDGYYDLQGRRVAQPTKGLYIQNGKKVFIK